MPLYNFKCKSCEEESEHLAKVGQKSVKCECGSTALKVFSPNKALFTVNGSGAYNAGVMQAK